MYYILDRFHATHPCRTISDYPYMEDVDWRIGARFVAPPPEPIEIELAPLHPHSSDESPDLPAYFKGRIPLMREDLVSALRHAGVDNLDLYNATVIDPDSDSRVTLYKAVNIIGAISAADMARSNATVHPGGAVIDVDFDGLTIDPAKARGVLMFRLAESINGIVVHERVRDHLLKAGFNELEFLDPADTAL
jgi:hypothetical protein